jgi:amidohydrolase
MGLMAAKILAAQRNTLPGNVLMVFQPAEELLSGAEAMLADGALEGVKADGAFSVHLANEQPAGTIGILTGPALTSADRIEITVTGRGGHGANPHRAVDPIVASAQVITALQTLVSRETHPLKTAVLSIGMINAGTAFNIIPDAVEMVGTFRCYEPDVREVVLEGLRRMVDGVAAGLGCTAEVRSRWLCPALVNDEAMSAIARRVSQEIVGPDATLVMEAKTGSDDLAHFFERVPGCYAFIGSAKTDGSPVAAHHNAKFDFDESVMLAGTDLLVRSALAFLGGA